jgi:undecaprenyl-diphosphatase
MDLLTALVLGVLQGVTEFLPVSSSGHLAVAAKMMGSEGEIILPYLAYFHLGTLLAILAYFRKDVKKLLIEYQKSLSGFFLSLKGKFKRTASGPVHPKAPKTNCQKLAAMIAAADAVTLLLGLLLHRPARAFGQNPLYAGAALLVTAMLLLVTEMAPKDQLVPKDIPTGRAYLIGLMQGLAVLPGLSRAACSISGAMFSGLSKKNAVRFSYLAAIPVILGAAVLELIDLPPAAGRAFVRPVLVGIAASAVTGYLVISFFLKFIRRHSFKGFALYCFLVGILSMTVGLIG